MMTSLSAYILHGQRSPSIVPLSRAIILLIHPPLVSSRTSFFTSASPVGSRRDLFCSHNGVLRPFFTPLDHPASTLFSRAPNATLCHPLSLLFPSPTTHLSHPPVAHRRDYGIFFHPRESALLECSTLTSNPVPTFSSDEPDLSQSRIGILA